MWGLERWSDVIENSKYIWEIYAAAFTKNLGRLCLYFLKIKPMRNLSYVTRTHLSKANPNEILHDDTHPIRQIQIFILQERQTLLTRLYKLELIHINRGRRLDISLGKFSRWFYYLHTKVCTFKRGRLCRFLACTTHEFSDMRRESRITYRPINVFNRANSLCYLDT